MEVLQQRDAEHAVKSMDANLAIGPVIHRSPSQPVSILEAAKDALDFLLSGIAHGHLFSGPVHTIGEQHSATRTMIDERLPGIAIEIKWQRPLTITSSQPIAEYVLQHSA